MLTLQEAGLDMPTTMFAATRAAARWIKEKGFTVSLGSWWDSETGHACVFSREDAGPATYGHPSLTVMLRTLEDGAIIGTAGKHGVVVNVRIPA